MKTHLKIVIISFLINSLFSCNLSENKKNLHGSDTVVFSDSYLDSIHICTQMPFLSDDGTIDSSAALGAFATKIWHWEPGQDRVLNVFFHDGERLVQSKVLELAKKWEPYANISFKLVQELSIADIKISFKHPWGGSWSYIGTDSKLRDTSMNFGWLTSTTEDLEYNRVVLHEFGHALGYIHEHQNPIDNPIKWDTAKVYAYFKKKDFTPQMIYDNIIKMEDNIMGSRFDPQSIMIYAIPSELTTNHKAYPGNHELSLSDKQTTRSIYTR